MFEMFAIPLFAPSFVAVSLVEIFDVALVEAVGLIFDEVVSSDEDVVFVAVIVSSTSLVGATTGFFVVGATVVGFSTGFVGACVGFCVVSGTFVVGSGVVPSLVK